MNRIIQCLSIILGLLVAQCVYAATTVIPVVIDWSAVNSYQDPFFSAADLRSMISAALRKNGAQPHFVTQAPNGYSISVDIHNVYYTVGNNDNRVVNVLMNWNKSDSEIRCNNFVTSWQFGTDGLGNAERARTIKIDIQKRFDTFLDQCVGLDQGKILNN